MANADCQASLDISVICFTHGAAQDETIRTANAQARHCRVAIERGINFFHSATNMASAG